jgi:hypothetical protein
MISIRFLVWSQTKEACTYAGCTREDCATYTSRWALPSGEVVEKPQPGDVYFRECHESNSPTQCWWTNCDGQHLTCVLPGGHHWNIDGRASNCTLKDEKTHRCWVRTGRPEDGTLDVGKGGHTCQAGAGSIAVDGYHGFLRHGALT